MGIPFQLLTVLVVDDLRLARRIAVRILSEEGYRVLEADCAEEALEVLSEARGRVDLVMLDVVMPNIDGVALTNSIRAEWPDQRLLYMSAHPAEILARHGLEGLERAVPRQAVYAGRVVGEGEIRTAAAWGK